MNLNRKKTYKKSHLNNLWVFFFLLLLIGLDFNKVYYRLLLSEEYDQQMLLHAHRIFIKKFIVFHCEDFFCVSRSLPGAKVIVCEVRNMPFYFKINR